MKKILVTGATGFIGDYVIKYLLNKNYPVIATSLSESNARKKDWFEDVTYISLDFKNIDSNKDYYSFFQQPDLLIHLAWEGLPNYKSEVHTKINLPLQSVLLKNLIDNGLSDITVTGTCFEYGMQEGCLGEDINVHPTNFYGIAKNELRIYLQELQNDTSFNFKWIRLFYLFGYGKNPNSLLSQLDKALANNETVFNMSGGQQVRDYLQIEKAAEYIVKIALQQKTQGVINCCSGEPVTIEEFVKNYLKKENKKISLNLGYYSYPDYEPMAFWGDNSKLKRIINNG